MFLSSHGELSTSSGSLHFRGALVNFSIRNPKPSSLHFRDFGCRDAGSRVQVHTSEPYFAVYQSLFFVYKSIFWHIEVYYGISEYLVVSYSTLQYIVHHSA